jgi:hypothetical protein
MWELAGKSRAVNESDAVEKNMMTRPQKIGGFWNSVM